MLQILFILGMHIETAALKDQSCAEDLFVDVCVRIQEGQGDRTRYEGNPVDYTYVRHS